MLAYTAKLTRDGEGWMITFSDFPEAGTYGRDREEALRFAVGALEEVIAARIADREDIPQPRRRRGTPVVLPTLTAAKVGLYQAMRQAGVHKAGLARRMGASQKQVDRLLDLNHASRLDQIDTALAALGKRLAVEVQEAA